MSEQWLLMLEWSDGSDGALESPHVPRVGEFIGDDRVASVMYSTVLLGVVPKIRSTVRLLMERPSEWETREGLRREKW